MRAFVSPWAVHPIVSVTDLKRRLGKGRRCFAYFHPAMPGEPLVFIEVALTSSISTSIQDVLWNLQPVPEDEATTAVFYSISNSQKGLGGIDLGHFLIKKVVGLLSYENPQIQTFATLSPIPGFLSWLLPKLALHSLPSPVSSSSAPSSMEDEREVAAAGHGAGGGGRAGGPSAFRDEPFLLPHEIDAIVNALATRDGNTHPPTTEGEAARLLYAALGDPVTNWFLCERTKEQLKQPLLRLCVRYLIKEKKRGRALDPVANFHIRNGAGVLQINWSADTSPKGVSASAGMMVNYLYSRADVDYNHKAYMSQGKINVLAPMALLLDD